MSKYIVGRDPEAADIVIGVGSKTVSRRHARLTIIDGQSCQIEDLDSSNGTELLDGHRWIPVKSAKVSRAQRLRFGTSHEATVGELLQQKAPARPAPESVPDESPTPLGGSRPQAIPLGGSRPAAAKPAAAKPVGLPTADASPPARSFEAASPPVDDAAAAAAALRTGLLRAQGKANLIYGVILFVVGGGITLLTFAAASSGGGGGRFVVAWGAMAVGVFKLIQGVVQFIRAG